LFECTFVASSNFVKSQREKSFYGTMTMHDECANKKPRKRGHSSTLADRLSFIRYTYNAKKAERKALQAVCIAFRACSKSLYLVGKRLNTAHDMFKVTNGQYTIFILSTFSQLVNETHCYCTIVSENCIIKHE